LALLVACGGGGGGAGDPGGDPGAPDVVATDATPDSGPAADVDTGSADQGAFPDPGTNPGAPPDDTGDVPPIDAADNLDAWAAQYGQGCALDRRIGRFEVLWSESATYAYGSVAGTVSDHVDALGVLQDVGGEGPCRLLQRQSPLCEPACTSGQQCTHDQGCLPWPVPQSVGRVVVVGLARPVVLEPNSGKTYMDTDFDEAPYEPQARVELVAEGGDVAGFALQGLGVPLLEVPEQVWLVERGKPLTVTWTPEPGPWDVFVSINVDQHGLTPVTMVCELEDTGSHTFPATLVDAFLDFGASGAATASFTRGTADSVETAAGCVELDVSSRRAVLFQVPGVAP